MKKKQTLLKLLVVVSLLILALTSLTACLDMGTMGCAHVYGEWEQTVFPMCEVTGELRRQCTKCGLYEVTATPALGHDYVHHDEKEATITEAGYKDYDTCTRCDYTTYEEIPALGECDHVAGDAVEENRVEATCDKDGSYDSVIYCLVCNTKLSTEHKTIDKLNHNYGEVSCVWNSDNTTCTATRVCSNDNNHKETETVNVVKTVIQKKDLYFGRVIDL